MNTQPESDLNQMYDDKRMEFFDGKLPKVTLCVESSIDQKFGTNQVQTKE